MREGDTTPSDKLLAPGPRFLAAVAAWVVGLFAILRIPAVEEGLLVPFAGLQQQLATVLVGPATRRVVVDTSCSGADALALCIGAILAFPASWASRLRALGAGLLLVATLNSVRIGSLALVAGRPGVFSLLHATVWPALLVGAVAVYVFLWMGSVTSGRPGLAGWRPSPVATRFTAAAAVLVATWFATTPAWLGSDALVAARGAVATTAGAMLIILGTGARVSGDLVSTSHGVFQVTAECVASPLIPAYLAVAMTLPGSWRARGLAVAAAPAVFFTLGTARLLVLALPAGLVASPALAVHAFNQVAAGLALVVAVAVWHGARREADRGTIARRALLAGLAAVGIALTAGPFWARGIRWTAASLLGALGPGAAAYPDPQGALAMLPAYQLGLAAGLLVALGGTARPGRVTRPARGVALALLAGLAVAQVGAVVALELAAGRLGFDPHVSLVRAWALLGAPAMLWLLVTARRSLPGRHGSRPTALAG